MKSLKGPARRNFLKQASILGAAALAAPAHTGLPAFAEEKEGGEHYNFLFQGDSITDGNRSRDMDWNHVLGHGYAYLIAADLLYRFPLKKLHFIS